MPHRPQTHRMGKAPPTTSGLPRPSANARGYTRRWQRASQAFLAEHPLCAECERQGLPLTAAEVVDHIIPHRGDEALFWAAGNLQALCVHHHNQKTARGQ